MDDAAVSSRTRLFLSYARGDDEGFVSQLYDDLARLGFDVWWDRVSMPSRGLTFTQEIRDAVEACDRLILVVGPRVAESDYVEAEWRHAMMFCAGAVVPVLRKGDYGLVPAQLADFHCPDFRAERPYAEACAELFRIVAKPAAPLGPLLTEVPSLPPHFQPREDELARLAVSVLADVRHPRVVTSEAQTTTVQGMGGIGKSVLAAAFARAPATRRAFRDGIAWLTVGRTPDPLELIRILASGLGEDLADYTELSVARNRLPQLLANRLCLLVLDDVWDLKHATPFRNALPPRCRLLITTRDSGIATSLGGTEHSMELLDEPSALDLLADWSGWKAANLPHEARRIAQECGNLPLAIALVGAMLRGKPNDRWSGVLSKLRAADLGAIHHAFPDYPYPTFCAPFR